MKVLLLFAGTMMTQAAQHVRQLLRPQPLLPPLRKGPAVRAGRLVNRTPWLRQAASAQVLAGG